MNKKSLIILALGLASVSAVAAPPGSKNFEEFRRGMHQRYDSFREEMLSNYAKFLDGEWVEFKWFPADERDATPKPQEAPQAPAVPERGPVTPLASPKPALPLSTAPVADAAPGRPAFDRSSAPADYETPAPDATTDAFDFDFYGVTMSAPQIDLRIMNRMTDTNDYASQWRELASTRESARLVSAIATIAREHGFNDYLTFDLARRYALARFPEASAASRTSLVHYIMANLGYDVRIGCTPDGEAVLMMPCLQTVYGKTYLMFGQEKYYVFTDPTVDLSTRRMAISTCQLPAVANTGKKIDLDFSPVLLPVNPKEFTITDGNLTITGTINANLYPIIYRYPQMPISGYAHSQLDPSVRASIVEQLKEQLAGKPQEQAVDELLNFVQKGFAYATDDEAHGFEKPYFFEETLFYPECDCEDRVIFYTYLLWNVLGVENHLLAFPGHESAAVALGTERTGDSYTYEGKHFLISDPTFIGARTGMCMPSYKSVTPEIDHIYK